MADFRVHHVRFFEFQPKAIHCIAYQSESERVAVSRSDGTIEIWSIKDNWLQEKVIVGDANRSVEAVVWCGRRLFTAGLSGDVVEYDLNKLQPIASVPSNAGPIWCLTKNSANTKLAAGTEAGCVVLYDLEGDLLSYKRAFDKQEGRILSLSWHVGGEVLVTGGVDNVRVWSVASGHAIQRLTLRRSDNNKETIVWCVAITGDMTIISGDSRGKTSFWNGKQGTLIKSFQSHKADVLCMSVNEKDDSVICSGVDPTLVKFEFISTMPNSDWKSWVRSSARCQHTHDVRALAHTGQHIVSGGVDTSLILNRVERKQDLGMSQRIPAVPQCSMVCVAIEAELLALNYGTYLEVWRLGSSGAKSEKHGDILPLRDNPVKLLQLKTKNSETVVCFAISQDGKWLCYSDQESLRFYRLHLENKDTVTPSISVERIKLTSPLNSAAHKVVFTPDSATCIAALCTGTVQIISVNSAFPSMHHSIPPLDEMSGCSVGLLVASSNSKLAAVYYHGNTIAIFDIDNKQHVCNVPQYAYQPTAMAFSPSSEDLVIAYADQKVLELSVTQQQYSTWSRQNMKKFHRHWLKRNAKISGISFNPRAPHQMVLHDIQMLCVLDKTQPFPGPEVNLHNRSTWSQETDSATRTDHAFHICNKYKYLLDVETLTDDWLLVVERPPSCIMDALPQTLKQKKFGT